MKFDFDESEGSLPSRNYSQLKDLHLLNDEVSSDDISISGGDWLNLNKQLENVAEEGMEGVRTNEEYDNLASGKAAVLQLTDVVEQFLCVDGKPLKFDKREYLRGIYNHFEAHPEGCKDTLLLASRQCEKSVMTVCDKNINSPSMMSDRQHSITTTSGEKGSPAGTDSKTMTNAVRMTSTYCMSNRVLLSTGEYKHMADVGLEDELITYDMDTHKSAVGKVTWKSAAYTKKAYRITTGQGHQITVGHEHPLYNGQDWIPAENWAVGDRIAVVGSADYVVLDTRTTEQDLHMARLSGHIVAEGSCSGNTIRFTTGSKECRDDFEVSYNFLFPKSKGYAELVWYNKAGKTRMVYSTNLRTWVSNLLRDEHGILPVKSMHKSVPAWLFSKNKEVRAAFLSRCWAGDGSVKDNKTGTGQINFIYNTISETLCQQIRALLWGFGIPTGLRIQQPKLYREKYPDRFSFILRIETRRGQQRFLDEIGAMDKTAGITLPDTEENNNKDTLPKAIINGLITEVFGAGVGSGLHGLGLQGKPAYALTRNKFEKYVEAAKATDREHKVFNKWRSDHIFWDKVASIEFIESEECQDFTVESEHNYVINGIITHNSTSQAAKSCALGMVFPSFKTLYVAPRYDQVIIFSQQRMRPMCEESKTMMKTFVSPGKCLWQVKARQFTNGSFFNFRSCFLNADNARGISANNLMIDEIQDVVPDAIPVLEQCQAHSSDELKYRLYAGTPKSTANVITLRWQDTCQFEWLVKCRACNYWNMCDETIIGPLSYTCANKRCEREVYPSADGQWVPKRPELLDKRWGFRLSQMMVPFKEHKHILADKNNPNVTRAKYLNETLGLPYDEGEVGITDTILERACSDIPMMSPVDIKRNYGARGIRVYAGVDYGTGEGSNPSYTVLTIGAQMPSGIFQVLFMKKFKGEDVSGTRQMLLIDKYCTQAGVCWLGADWGFGHHVNERLIEERGWDRYQGSRILMEFKYTSQIKEVQWKHKQYHADRNQTMGRVIDAIRKKDSAGRIMFFRYDQMAEFKNDLTTIFVEYNEVTGRTKYAHQLPDDAFHSINYAYMAARQGSGKGLPSGYWNL